MAGPLGRAWGRMYARGYDLLFRAIEENGLRQARRELIGSLSGRVLEIGAGTGLNAAHYSDAVTELVLTEPVEAMAQLLERRPEAGRATVMRASADALPFPDDHFDAVVCTLVLCSVPHPGAALAEVRRVLKPGGRLVFIEHVRSPDARTARWQDRLNRPWRAVNVGCNCNRDTEASVRAAGLEIVQLERRRFEGMPWLASPQIVGAAKAP